MKLGQNSKADFHSNHLALHSKLIFSQKRLPRLFSQPKSPSWRAKEQQHLHAQAISKILGCDHEPVICPVIEQLPKKTMYSTIFRTFNTYPIAWLAWYIMWIHADHGNACGLIPDALPPARHAHTAHPYPESPPTESKLSNCFLILNESEMSSQYIADHWLSAPSCSVCCARSN